MSQELDLMRRCRGMQAAPIPYYIDSGSVRLFADSLMDPDPALRVDPSQDPSGGGRVIAPPTFFGGATGLSTIRAGDPKGMFSLPLPVPEGWLAIATGDDFEFFHPVRTGMTLVSHERFEDAREKQGRTGRLIFFEVSKEFRTIDGTLVLRRTLHCVTRPLGSGATPASAGAEGMEFPSGLPPVTIGPVTIRYLSMFAVATAEPVDIHYDADYARSTGLPGVIIQGLYKTALIGRMLKDWLGDPRAVRRLTVQHRRMDLAGATLTAGGAIMSPFPVSLPAPVTCRVQVSNERAVVTTMGTAEVLVPESPRCREWLRQELTKERTAQ